MCDDVKSSALRYEEERRGSEESRDKSKKREKNNVAKLDFTRVQRD